MNAEYIRVTFNWKYDFDDWRIILNYIELRRY